MVSFCVGDMASEARTTSKVSTAYRLLDAKIRTMGLYNTDFGFYIREALKFVVMWAIVLYLALGFSGSYLAVGCSALMCAAMWHQAAFVAHDAGHTGITHDQWTDTVLGICLGNFLGGVSLGWWKHNHNVHHIVTNHPEHDPDIQHMPFFAVSIQFVKNLYSTYYKRTLEFDAFAKVLIPLQHYLFYVILCFGRFNLYALSWMHVSQKGRVPHRALEITGLTFFNIWYLLVLRQIYVNAEAVGVSGVSLVLMHLLVSHVLTVFLHLQITLSHFGMDTSLVENEGYAEMALRTTMDIDCPRWMDWFHGGLQFQVEHHLFPRVPRHNLRAVRPLVEEFARENNLNFYTFNFLKGNQFVIGELKKVAKQVSDYVKMGASGVAGASGSRLHAE
ncbi:hypothetical protein HDU76_002151 [Blyttiomyces sp. JEL0837]|nr:hypothetical protein HDU76_002151 [Blyttiomyces sp. JEL0837]